MPSGPTPHYPAWIKPLVGGDAATWGATINSTLDAIDATVFANQTAGATNTTNIATNTATIAAHTATIATHTTNIAANTAAIAALPVGVTNGSNAAAGKIGEYLSSSIALGSALALTTATPRNITSLTLSAGDWDVHGLAQFSSASAGIAVIGAVSMIPANVGANWSESSTGAMTGTCGVAIFPLRVSSASPTTVYLVAEAYFSSGSISGFGSISARRVR